MQIAQICELEKIPASSWSRFAVIKECRFFANKRGVTGGYYLARPAEEIKRGQIVRILDGPLAPIRCVSQMAYEPCGCPDERSCGLRLVMADVRNAIADILDNTSLADVSARSRVLRLE